MKTTLFMALIALPLFFLTIGGVVYLFILLCRALKKYISSSDFRKESAIRTNVHISFWNSELNLLHILENFI